MVLKLTQNDTAHCIVPSSSSKFCATIMSSFSQSRKYLIRSCKNMKDSAKAGLLAMREVELGMLGR
jgi:hypothetical protein